MLLRSPPTFSTYILHRRGRQMPRIWLKMMTCTWLVIQIILTLTGASTTNTYTTRAPSAYARTTRAPAHAARAKRATNARTDYYKQQSVERYDASAEFDDAAADCNRLAFTWWVFSNLFRLIAGQRSPPKYWIIIIIIIIFGSFSPPTYWWWWCNDFKDVRNFWLRLVKVASSITGLSQVGTPMAGEFALGVGADPLQSAPLRPLAPLLPTPPLDSMPTADNIQRMLLKQNIIRWVRETELTFSSSFLYHKASK